MSNPQRSDKRSVTLEELLRFKRAERPSPEFWVTFERELRAKQLAAIVEKRPWWRARFSFAGFARYRVALGACAILTLTFVSIREYHSRPGTVPVAPVATGAVETIASQPAETAESVGVIASVASAEADQIVAASASLPDSASQVNDTEDRTTLAANAPVTVGAISQVVSWGGSGGAAPVDLSPTAKSIAENLAAAEEAHPELTRRFFGSLGGFEKRGMPAARQVTDPLAQMKSPAELHRERLLASALPVASINSRTADRVARRISDERLTEDAISRFGARGDRVLVKF